MRNIEEKEQRLVALRAGLAKLDRSRPARVRAARSSGDHDLLDRLEPRAVHDLYADTPADAVALNAFGLGLAVKAAGGRPIVWAIHRLVETETGTPHGPGLHEMGIRPRDVLLVRANDIQTLLAVGEEALRSPAVGAVLLSAWGEAKAMTLTASRRLSLAAQAGTATLFLARAGAVPAPSAALTRWSVGASPSTPLEAGAPGRPSFSATLLRHRGGVEPRTWIMEWDRERRAFLERSPLSGAVVPVAAERAPAPWRTGERRVA
ncbi:hypothetical protein MMB232_02859 [Brevundimonas subvibrioides]|uniref:ImuA family protein n=1 Tax=Brevundimonas subvibrioides TaxID=74313 RepID=UPI0032D5A120